MLPLHTIWEWRTDINKIDLVCRITSLFMKCNSKHRMRGAINHLLYAKILSKVAIITCCRLVNLNILSWRKKPNNCGIRTSFDNVLLCIWVLLTLVLELTLVDTKHQNIKTYQQLHRMFLFFQMLLLFFHPSLLSQAY